jgi:hypothetical protein
VRQQGSNQVLGALANGLLDQGIGDRGQVQISHGAVQGHLKITQGVHHGAVQVKNERLDLPQILQGADHHST